jgi:hypothetical protein
MAPGSTQVLFSGVTLLVTGSMPCDVSSVGHTAGIRQDDFTNRRALRQMITVKVKGISLHTKPGYEDLIAKQVYVGFKHDVYGAT